MAMKKVKAKKVKKAKAKTKAATVRSGESKPRLSVANFVRDQLERDVEPAKIVEKAAAAFPGKKPTVGYVNWIKQHAPKTSTTQNSAATM